MLLTNLLSQVPHYKVPMIDMGNCFSIKNPGKEITLAINNKPKEFITLPVVLDRSPRIIFNYRFQFDYGNMTYYANPDTDFALFSDYTTIKELERDLQSIEGADAYFTFHDQVSGFGDSIKCFARFVAGTYTVDNTGYAHIRLF